ncbi:MAG: type VI secretion system-associated FHA domain protein [Tateyamaria sp.]|uniref:type VI secretion system-associated FHA domain protein n=1 Tax=Tateyamaria sp. TaxID=1929288 RepID=UPI00329BD915
MDRLTLRIENRSDAAGDMPEDISVHAKGISIGRKANNDWSLPDNTRFISGHHVSVTVENDTYLLEDVSTNGTFVNGASQRISGKHKLSDGDTIRIGSYIVGVVLEEVEDPILPQITGAQGVQAPPSAGVMNPATTGVQRVDTSNASASGAQTPDFSQFQTGNKGATGVQRPGAVSMPPGAALEPVESMIPDDFDDFLDLVPVGSNENMSDDVIQEPIPDPTPEQVAIPDLPATPEPIPTPKASAAPPDETPVEQVISFADPAPNSTNDALPDPTPAQAVVPEPVPERVAGPFSETPIEAAPVPETPTLARNPDGPFSMSDPVVPQVVPTPASAPAVKATPVVEKTDVTPRGLGERFAETAAPRQNADPIAREPLETPPAPEPAPPATNALLEGFLEGAGIDDPGELEIPLRELGVMLGQCARLGTQEMMHMLQDRSAVKLFVAQEDRTMRIASGNNPMKFMMDPNDAFKALFVQPRDGYQTGPDGFDNALNDIRQHQQAMMAAIQPALADMLEGLAPTEISQDVGGGGGVLGGGARKSWEEYNKRWDSRAAQGENGMLDAFIDAFSRRYNQALDTL